MPRNDADYGARYYSLQGYDMILCRSRDVGDSLLDWSECVERINR